MDGQVIWIMPQIVTCWRKPGERNQQELGCYRQIMFGVGRKNTVWYAFYGFSSQVDKLSSTYPSIKSGLVQRLLSILLRLPTSHGTARFRATADVARTYYMTERSRHRQFE